MQQVWEGDERRAAGEKTANCSGQRGVGGVTVTGGRRGKGEERWGLVHITWTGDGGEKAYLLKIPVTYALVHFVGVRAKEFFLD